MVKLSLVSFVYIALSIVLAPGANGQLNLPWGNLNEFLEALRNFNLFSRPNLDVTDAGFQEYVIFTDLFRNRQARLPPECAACDPNASCLRRGGSFACVCNRFFEGSGQVCVFVPGPSGTEPPGGCPGNRIFTECYTCDILCSARNGIGCPDTPCSRGCGCPPNFYINSAGLCVPEASCDDVPLTPSPTLGGCPGGRQFTNCARCDVLCRDRFNPPACTQICRPGCSCPSNYFLNEDGNCVTVDNCARASTLPAPTTTAATTKDPTTVCPRGRVYSSCARCDLRCDERFDPPPCTDICRPGCSCPNNYYIDANGFCVTPGSCPATTTVATTQPTQPPFQCRGGRVYSDCARCDVTCLQRNDPPLCTLDCRNGCTCPPNYFTNNFGVCVPANLCPRLRPIVPLTSASTISFVSFTPRTTIRSQGGLPPNCPGNQIYTTCLRCIYTCAERNTIVPEQCVASCESGCGCPDGRYLDPSTRRCLTAQQCGGGVAVTTTVQTTVSVVPVCPENQVYSNCARCPVTCNNFLFDRPPCTEQCRQGCICEEGYVLNGRSCTAPTDCPDITFELVTTTAEPPTTPAPTEALSRCGGECINGVCVEDRFGQYFCRCPQGYRGIFCEERTTQPIFFQRNCVPECQFPETCVFRGAAGFECVLLQ